MSHNPASFPRREFLTGAGALGALGALAAVVGQGLPRLSQATANPLPEWASSTPRAAQAYRAALASAPLLAELPCYCGCMESSTLAHASLRDCFLTAEGSLNPHGAGCGICVNEALSATTWQASGLSVAEIHGLIDETYGGAGCTVDRCVE